MVARLGGGHRNGRTRCRGRRIVPPFPVSVRPNMTAALKSGADALSAAVQKVLADRRPLSPLANELGTLIVGGSLSPGSALSEKMFGDRRAISRTSFREAIKVLEGKGLIYSRQSVGTIVADRGEWRLLDPDMIAWRIATGSAAAFLLEFMEFRQAVEPAAAETAARRRNKERIAAVRAAVTAMRALEKRDPFGSEFMELDIAFHRSVFRASQNEFFDALGGLLEIPFRIAFVFSTSERFSPLVDLHEELVVQIEKGEPVLARNASAVQLSFSKRDLLKSLRSR